eukprot:CAMPEP_0172190018 /NCGR_PEP_ID=MMETSP1050-20130122/22868_1 /TAXON_ID=233186 /ORGANISM="Cryptomonas curvata, Strain CCAP979/52" /LENGTH=106 /DNA_ID=CAMNT_0012864821 /DNA_START=138 /DNA_END=458 /DNA_ORIENTATION=-
MNLAHPDFALKEFSLLVKMHGAFVIGLGLVAITAAQFEEAESRNKVAGCMFLIHALLLLAMWQEWKVDGHVKPPILICTIMATFLYSVAYTAILDGEQEDLEHKQK